MTWSIDRLQAHINDAYNEGIELVSFQHDEDIRVVTVGYKVAGGPTEYVLRYDYQTHEVTLGYWDASIPSVVKVWENY